MADRRAITSQLGTATAIASQTSVNVTAATLDLNGFSPTINGLLGNGKITDGVATASVLTIGDADATASFSGVIQDGVGTAVAATKQGTGDETLAGANAYSGTTTITAGKIILGATNALSIGGDRGRRHALDLGFNQQVANITGSGTVTSGTAAIFTINNAGGDTFAGVIGGSVALTKSATGKLILQGTSNYTGIPLSVAAPCN